MGGHRAAKASGRMPGNQRESVKSKKPLVASRVDRRNHAAQVRKAKNAALMETRRIGTSGGPPRIVGIVSLHSSLSSEQVLSSLTTEYPPEAHSPLHIHCKQWKVRAHLLPAHTTDLLDVLHVASASDVLIVMLSPYGLDDDARHTLSLLLSNGCPPIVAAVAGPCTDKKRIEKELEKVLSEDIRVVEATDASQLMRWVAAAKLRTIRHRDNHSYMVVDSLQIMEGGSNGKVVFGGYVRGQNLSANQLLHIAKFGTVAIDRIESQDGTVVLDVPTEERESLQAENVPDSMAGEQTWPTEEELAQAEAEERKKLESMIDAGVRKRRVPKGYDEIKAAWARHQGEAEYEDEDEEMEGDDDDHGEDEDDDDLEKERALWEQEMVDGTKDEDDGSDGSDEDMGDDEQDAGTLRKMRAMQDDVENEEKFPDEVDTPLDQPARLRFARYRGLKSFRFSRWDPYENLPLDYSRIYSFTHFKSIQRQEVEAAQSERRISEGTYVRIHVSVAPSAISALSTMRPIVLVALNKYENRVSLCNFKFVRHPSCEEPLKNKDEFVFVVGFRSFVVRPIFSELNPRADKHRMLRYVLNDAHVCASAFLPVTYTPCPLLVFRRNENGQVSDLVGTGSLLSVDPNRVVLKRVVLSGYPFRVHKRHAVIRYMFFNPEDVSWFKPVELRTKMGLHGHIKESVGTHGSMKCRFDKMMKGSDTVLMPLYKRVYPKWTTKFLGTMGEGSISGTL